MGNIEIANGYQELCDEQEQRQRFENDQRIRQQHGLSIRPLDQYFLTAMQNGIPECSGVAMGIDRLLAKITKAEQLQAVLSFDWGNS